MLFLELMLYGLDIWPPRIIVAIAGRKVKPSSMHSEDA